LGPETALPVKRADGSASGQESSWAAHACASVTDRIPMTYKSPENPLRPGLSGLARISYLARDTNLDQFVAIKEYLLVTKRHHTMPEDVGVRDAEYERDNIQIRNDGSYDACVEQESREASSPCAANRPQLAR
jgi:hypothetical protein